jgi:hypothetical protein
VSWGHGCRIPGRHDSSREELPGKPRRMDHALDAGGTAVAKIVAMPSLDWIQG